MAAYSRPEKMKLTVEYSTDEFYRICFGHAIEQALLGKDIRSSVDDYGDYTSCVLCETKPPNFGRIKGETKMAKLELALLVGESSKKFLSDLTDLVERLEKMADGGITTTGKKAKPAVTTAAEVDYEGEDDENVKPAKRAGKKAADEEENFDLGADEVAEGNEDPITIKEVIAACRANRETAIKVLKKLKVNSVHELKPAQYAKVMSEIGA